MAMVKMKNKVVFIAVLVLALAIALVCLLYFRSFRPYGELKAEDAKEAVDLSYFHSDYELSEDEIVTLAEALNSLEVRRTLTSRSVLEEMDGSDRGIDIRLSDGSTIYVEAEGDYFIIDDKMYKVTDMSYAKFINLESELMAQASLRDGNWDHDYREDETLLRDATNIVGAVYYGKYESDNCTQYVFRVKEEIKGNLPEGDSEEAIFVRQSDSYQKHLDEDGWAEPFKENEVYLLLLKSTEEMDSGHRIYDKLGDWTVSTRDAYDTYKDQAKAIAEETGTLHVDEEVDPGDMVPGDFSWELVLQGVCSWAVQEDGLKVKSFCVDMGEAFEMAGIRHYHAMELSDGTLIGYSKDFYIEIPQSDPAAGGNDKTEEGIIRDIIRKASDKTTVSGTEIYVEYYGSRAFFIVAAEESMVKYKGYYNDCSEGYFPDDLNIL